MAVFFPRSLVPIIKAKKRLTPLTCWRDVGAFSPWSWIHLRGKWICCSPSYFPLALKSETRKTRLATRWEKWWIKERNALLWCVHPTHIHPHNSYTFIESKKGNVHIPQIWHWEEGKVIRIPYHFAWDNEHKCKNLGIPFWSWRKTAMQCWNTKL